ALPLMLGSRIQLMAICLLLGARRARFIPCRWCGRGKPSALPLMLGSRIQLMAICLLLGARRARFIPCRWCG
ncbi:hypothetical protein C3E93_28610, partial [Klebsiella pneumoniae]